MTFAIVRVRSTVKAKPDIRKTLEMLKLNKVNHCVLVPQNKYYLGMLKKVKDYVTWGEVKPGTVEKLIFRKGGEYDESQLKEASKFKDLKTFSQAVSAGKAEIKELPGVERVFRLHPPIKGYEGIKRSYVEGGALGYRGEDINKLIDRMIPEELE